MIEINKLQEKLQQISFYIDEIDNDIKNRFECALVTRDLRDQITQVVLAHLRRMVDARVIYRVPAFNVDIESYPGQVSICISEDILTCCMGPGSYIHAY